MASVSTSTEARTPTVERDDADGDAIVHPAGSYRPGALRWGYFLVLNAIAGAIAVAFFVGVFYADGLDPYLAGTYRWLLDHPGATSVMAFSPMLASLLVGWGYSQRARRRKKLAAERAARVKAPESGSEAATDLLPLESAAE